VRQKTPRALLLLIALAIPLAARAVPAPETGPSHPDLRYHYGDNTAWSDPHFDDSAWPSTQTGIFPSPAYQSDGYFWVRARLVVPPDAASLSIELQTDDPFSSVQELWVNGRLIGSYGDFPPRARPLIHPQKLVFDVPPGTVQPGSVVVVALRTWNAPSDWNESLVLRIPDPVRVEFLIAPAPLLHALAAQAQDRAWLNYWPQVTLALVFIMLGIAVLTLGIWAQDRALLLCAIWLVVQPVFLAFGPLRLLLAGVAAPTVFTAFLIVNAVGMCVTVEFLWTVQAFRDRIFRAALHLCWVGVTAGGIYSSIRMRPGTSVAAGMLTENWLLFAFNVIAGGANLIALAGRGRNRPVATAMLLIDIGYFLGIAGHGLDIEWHGFDLFRAAFYLCTLFIAILLMRQTWTAWRKAEDLRIDFAAAREVQQQLVPLALPAIAGWRMEAAYLPAAEVGGDFYHVIEQPGATILLIGDVSGKGLKAAMTGLLTIGAASALASERLSPAQLLDRLNREMVRLQKGGFVTCLCASVAVDGAVTLANAGHLAPYRNGEEVPLESGLPLGIAPDATYAESSIQLAPADRLTFMSDGVVEAQSQTGELFGFDRTRNISTQSAEAIAHAAQSHGQEDDITVLTLTFAPAEVAHASRTAEFA
jgi:sigma-B regulation protein RsbU (phosphoserine phosphatase)